MRSGLIVREADPINLESPPGSHESFLTDTRQFFVRNHFDVPTVDAATWRLEITGAVGNGYAIGPAELKRLPTETRTATLECAGNHRVYLVPKAKGLLWGAGAVGTAEWQGVPLRTLLDRSGINPDAVEVIFEGLDSGEVRDEPKTPGVISYARSIPIAKVDDVLIAHGMNGSDLEPIHGWPVRAIVGGYYGMASVKWLTRIVVTNRPFVGYFQSLEYATFDRQDGFPSLAAVTTNAVKAQIVEPMRGEVIEAGTDYKIQGKAWAGEATVTRVEWSADGGAVWSDAFLLGEPIRHTWREWAATWKVPAQPGDYQLGARATDDQGRTQPLARDLDLRTYAIHHVIPIGVVVCPADQAVK